VRPPDGTIPASFPRGAALGRVIGVIAGLAFMAVSMPYLGFAAAGFVTMIILLRAVEKSGWIFSIVLAFLSVLIVEWLFGHVLGMTLPRSPWGW
jgi:putative tricarboxylic transport membrane protein